MNFRMDGATVYVHLASPYPKYRTAFSLSNKQINCNAILAIDKAG